MFVYSYLYNFTLQTYASGSGVSRNTICNLYQHHITRANCTEGLTDMSLYFGKGSCITCHDSKVREFRSELFNPLNEGTVMGIPSNVIVPEYFKEPSYIYSINQLKQGKPCNSMGIIYMQTIQMENKGPKLSWLG